MNETVKAGVKTSEFWVTIIAYIIVTTVTVLNGFFDIGLTATDIASTVLPVVFYILGRSGVKMFSKETATQVVEKIQTIASKPVPGQPLNVSIPKSE